MAGENGLPAFEPESLLLSIMNEEGPDLKRFDTNQLLSAAVLAAAIVLAALLRSV